MSEVTISEAEYHRLLKKAGEAFEPNPAKCRENGHVWKSLGGANAGCCRDCQCSVAVNHCIVCGDCDYGETPENAEIIKNCSFREELEAEAALDEEAA